MNRFISAVIWGIVNVTMVCKTSGNPFQIIVIATLLLVGSQSGHAATKYPAGTPASAIATDQAVKMSIAGKPGIEFCNLIDTRTGRCTLATVLWAGGPGSGDGGGAGAGAGGSAGGGSSGSSGGGGSAGCK